MAWGLLGLERPGELLSALLRSGRIPHALLFTGPAGGGKNSLARAFAAALNCAGPDPAAGPCGRCPSCRKIDRDIHPDLATLTPGGASRIINLEAIEELRRKMAFRPFEGRSKVFIIREADRLGPEAGQALLKTLEEPPPDSAVLLTSTAEGGVMGTIRSRCLAVRLPPLAPALVLRTMAEKRGLTGPSARLLAALSGGALGPALAGDPEAAWARWLALNRIMAAADTPESLELAWSWVAEVAGDRDSWPEVLALLRLWWRQTFRLAALGRDDGEGPPPEPAQSLWAARLTPRLIARAGRALDRLTDSLDRYLKPELALENYWLTVLPAQAGAAERIVVI
ncbi:MAG: DNA polymerase III subunit delta' [Candidatus Adiutrix sp.]|jgi:DNA polymerase-3 subunit delta'|nr:DNA polymerase III subunit delta' [Candidatus Adiutrix sp.]